MVVFSVMGRYEEGIQKVPEIGALVLVRYFIGGR